MDSPHGCCNSAKGTVAMSADKDEDVSAGQLPVQKLLPAVYQDLLQPGVKQLGKALENVLCLIPTLMLPLRFLHEKAKLHMQQRLNDCREKLAKIPTDKVISIAPEIGVPILNKLFQTQDGDLVNLYTELLAKAANQDTVQNAHPAFVAMLENLSPDEALILAYLARKYIYLDVLDLAFPVLQIYRNGGVDGFVHVLGPLTNWNLCLDLHFESNIPVYLGNLTRLGIIRIDFSSIVAEESEYDDLLLTYKNFDVPSFLIRKGYCEITSFGAMFIKACIPDKSI